MTDRSQNSAQKLAEILKRSDDQKAKRYESLRDTVASSGVPLSAEVLQAMITLPDDRSSEIFRAHPGYALAERRSSYLASLSIAKTSISDLLTAIALFERDAIGEKSDILSHSSEKKLENHRNRIQKELFSAANAAVSLIDHSRRVQKRFELSDYGDKLRACFGSDGLNDFVVSLRILLHHLRVVDTGWNIQKRFSDSVPHASFMLNKATFILAIEQFPERFGGKKGEPLRAYLEDSGDRLDLKSIFMEYQSRLLRFHSWLGSQLESNCHVALRDYDHCLREKKNFAARVWWNILLGNWLRNWKVPPNPHDHLHKYLTHRQLEEVSKLPHNSKEQVDLVIHYLDVDQAIDDRLRKLAYELFDRSSSESC